MTPKARRPGPTPPDLSPRILKALRRDEGGATAVEYGLLVAGLALAILTAVGAVGTNISGVMTKVANALH
jgi:pilus assembly protein Flp/PilA